MRWKASGGDKLSRGTGVIMVKWIADDLPADYSWVGRKYKKYAMSIL